MNLIKFKNKKEKEKEKEKRTQMNRGDATWLIVNLDI